MVKKFSLIALVCVFMSAFLFFGCDGGTTGCGDTVKELGIDLTNLPEGLGAIIEIVDPITSEVLVTQEGIPGEVNVVTIVDPTAKKVVVNVKVFDITTTDVIVDEESVLVNVSVTSKCIVNVNVDVQDATGVKVDVTVDCPSTDVGVDVDVPWQKK